VLPRGRGGAEPLAERAGEQRALVVEAEAGLLEHELGEEVGLELAAALEQRAQQVELERPRHARLGHAPQRLQHLGGGERRVRVQGGPRLGEQHRHVAHHGEPIEQLPLGLQLHRQQQAITSCRA
jgi:hypothetical protein